MKLAQLDVDTLICGAISRPLAGMAIAHGIRMVSFVAGEVKNIITACLNDDLPNPAFAMPGCCERQMRFELERYSIQKNETELTNETEREKSDIMPKSNGREPQSKDPESGSGHRPCGTAGCKRPEHRQRPERRTRKRLRSYLKIMEAADDQCSNYPL